MLFSFIVLPNEIPTFSLSHKQTYKHTYEWTHSTVTSLSTARSWMNALCRYQSVVKRCLCNDWIKNRVEWNVECATDVQMEANSMRILPSVVKVLMLLFRLAREIYGTHGSDTVPSNKTLPRTHESHIEINMYINIYLDKLTADSNCLNVECIVPVWQCWSSCYLFIRLCVVIFFYIIVTNDSGLRELGHVWIESVWCEVIIIIIKQK